MKNFLSNIPDAVIIALVIVALLIVAGVVWEYWAAAEGVGKLLPNGG